MAVMLINVGSLPWVVDPSITASDSSKVATLVDHVLGKMTLLLLVLVVQDKDRELCLFCATAEILGSDLNIFLELADGVFERGSGVIYFVNDEDVLSDQVGHL